MTLGADLTPSMPPAFDSFQAIFEAFLLTSFSFCCSFYFFIFFKAVTKVYVFVCIFCVRIKASTVPNVTSLLSHWNLLISPAPDLTVSLSPELAALCYLIGNLTFHYLTGLCSSPTEATCSKAQAAVTRSPFWKRSLSLS